MGGDRKPGPLCGSELGADFIDAGTMCRSESKAPGSLGARQPVAAPKRPRLPGETVMLTDNIDTIAKSPFGRTGDGPQIVAVLRRLNLQDNVYYGETHPIEEGGEPPRGEEDGKSITITKEFYPNAHKTIVELVHEASHVLWRGNHPTNKGKQESIGDATEDEYRSIKNQLAIYVWLRTVSHAQPDWVLDRRLEQEEGGTLRSSIEERLKASRQRQ